MRAIVKKAIPNRLRRYFYRLGCSLVDMELLVQPSMKWSLLQLRELGFTPEAIIDVGAYEATWTEMIKEIYPEARVLMVEAQPGKREILEANTRKYGDSVEICIALLASSDGQKLRFSEMETGSSVFEERSSIPRNTVERESRSLDSVAAEFGFERATLLKLDVQGFELEVLKGARGLLKSVEAVLMEVSLLEINRGAPIIDQVLDFMRERGFVCYDICSLIRRPRDHALWQTDLIFLREESPLRDPVLD